MIIFYYLIDYSSSYYPRSDLSIARQSMKAIMDAVKSYNKANEKELTDLKVLVPDYLTKLKNDPWGNEYILLPEDGVIISAGPDEKYTPYLFREDSNLINRINRDNIEVYYKPKLGIKNAKITLDKNKNNRLDVGDMFTIFFTKGAGGSGTGDIDDIQAKPVKVQNNGEDFNFLKSPEGTEEVNISVKLISKEMLNGDKDSDKVVFEVEKLEKNIDNKDVFVCFDLSSTDPATGTYWDRRGVKAISNGYAVKIEP